MSFAALRRLRVCRIFREGRCGDLYRANVYLVHFQLRAKNVRTYFLMAFASLIAAIHWFDYFAGHLPWMSPLYNSVPLIVLASMAVLSRQE